MPRYKSSFSFPLLLSCFLMSLLFVSCDKKEENNEPEEEVRIRKNAKDMSPQEMADYVEAILLLKATPSPYSDTLSYYDQFVRFHQMAVERKMCTEIGVAHTNPAFPAWHRKMLILYEEALSEVSGKNIALPYWDWTDQASTDATFSSQLMGGSGDPNEEYAVMDGPFRKDNWQVNLLTISPNYIGLNPHPWLVRNFAATLPNSDKYPGYPVRLPLNADIMGCLDIDIYDVAPWDCSGSRAENASFRFCLEGFLGMECGGAQAMHNIGHDWIAGFFEVSVDTVKMIPTESINSYCGNTMRDTVPNNIRVGSMEPLDVSPNDPAFFMHHCNVDRIWDVWQQIPGNEMKYEPVSGAAEGYNLRDQMYPFSLPQFQGKGTMNDHGLTPESMLSVGSLGYEYQ
jgi:tyrosinase